jgi:CheY-like chemotaxis protein
MPTGEPMAEHEHAESRPARRLLLVEDDPTLRRAFAMLLRVVGDAVTEADGGAAGLRVLAEAPIDLVLTDLDMPDLTGWDVARESKALRPHVPVILLTGWGEQAESSHESHRQVDRILRKPVHLADLQQAIAELCPANGAG